MATYFAIPAYKNLLCTMQTMTLIHFISWSTPGTSKETEEKKCNKYSHLQLGLFM